ncbi:MAG: methyltransferase FkbM [Rhodospirillales bacterium RIFCSPLOWO2_12_FULL_58_28]|nr:MAG: methyltransferase FkbM [Rhodospirillales bacterium RIFCSPLOWO2_02_FULL_58_16]OHC79035.1 MAG: methyltransferase FkbM [Rhodospirillales bacterium RIFCSPLOWO2_12_FULL_58_28]
MNRKRFSLVKTIGFKSCLDVVDIGANPIDGEAPYKRLLDSGHALVVGFEPNPDAMKILNEKKGRNETYLPYAVFDGNVHQFRVCQSPGMSSLLEPDRDILRYFHGFPDWGTVNERREIKTVRLDDIKEIKSIDYLKIDIQGGELEVFRNGVGQLANCLVIHAEVEFLPMYENQPLFSEVEIFLRGQGFLFHRFAPLASRAVQPMLVDNDIHKGLGQIFWADAVFIRDFTKLDALSPLRLKKMALILHDIYGSCDLALRCLMACDGKMQNGLAEKYMKALSD